MVFQDTDRTNELQINLKETALKEDSYFIPTLPHDPTPSSGGWDSLLHKLKNLGVNEVIMAGMNLVIEWPDDTDPKVGGCLASAAEELSKVFKVNISKFTYPNTKEDYARFHGPKGPEDHKPRKSDH